ncbi:FAD-dependent monooxygenase, partial [Rhizobium ruizarguesonis]
AAGRAKVQEHRPRILEQRKNTLRAGYLVGCDGGRSLVRKVAGIAFEGWDPTTGNILAEVEMEEETPLGIHRTALGIYAFGR